MFHYFFMNINYIEMLLTTYQTTEVIIGTTMFPILYFLYLFFTETNIIYWDIIWCTITILIILIFRYFYINFNILQSQNLNMTLY
jgi:hypothetical protein